MVTPLIDLLGGAKRGRTRVRDQERRRESRRRMARRWRSARS
jgi:hypothetical protein